MNNSAAQVFEVRGIANSPPHLEELRRRRTEKSRTIARPGTHPRALRRREDTGWHGPVSPRLAFPQALAHLPNLGTCQRAGNLRRFFQRLYLKLGAVEIRQVIFTGFDEHWQDLETQIIVHHVNPPDGIEVVEVGVGQCVHFLILEARKPPTTKY